MTENTPKVEETPDENKHPLARKIDSIEKFNTAINTQHDGKYPIGPDTTQQQLNQFAGFKMSPSAGVSGTDGFGYDDEGYTQTWWLDREMWREANGVYERPTDVLMGIRKCYGVLPYFPHISTKVAGEIAYTASRRDGENDRQVRTTLGKFLSKYVPLLTDKAIAAIVEAHNAELDDTFLIADTPEMIEHVYRNMQGDTGCMRYSAKDFHSKYHPSLAYAYEGLAVAYLQDADGVVKARALTYINPNDPKDKRFVRVYGLAVLGRKLERCGYKMEGLSGARIRYIPWRAYDPDDTVDYEGIHDDEDSGGELPNDPSTTNSGYAMVPYVDPAGGIHSGVRAKLNAPYAIGFEGDDFLMLISDDIAAKASAQGLTYASVRNSNAKCAITLNVKKPELFGDCALTGKPFNFLTDECYFLMREKGKIETVLGWDCLDDAGYNTRVVQTVYANGRSTRRDVWMNAEDAKQWAYGGYMDDHGTWKWRGYLPLDPNIYPERVAKGGPDAYVEGSYAVHVRNENGVDWYANKHDCVLFQVHGRGMQHIHKSNLPENAVQIVPHPDYAQDVYSTMDHPQLVKTAGGKYGILGWSRVFLHTDGKYVTGSVGHGVNVFGMHIRATSGVHPKDGSEKFIDMLVERIKSDVADMGCPEPREGTYREAWADRICREIGKSIAGNSAPMIYGNALSPRNMWDDFGPRQVVMTHRRIEQMKEIGIPLSNHSSQRADAWELWFRVASRFIDNFMLAGGMDHVRSSVVPPQDPRPPVPQPVTEVVVAGSPITAEALEQMLAEPMTLPATAVASVADHQVSAFIAAA